MTRRASILIRVASIALWIAIGSIAACASFDRPRHLAVPVLYMHDCELWSVCA